MDTTINLCGMTGQSAIFNIMDMKIDGRKKTYDPKTSFQKWLKPLLERNAAEGKSPSDYADIHKLLILRGVDVAENTLYRVVRGTTSNSGMPEYNLTYHIGEIMGDLEGALRSRDFMLPPGIGAKKREILLTPPSDFVTIRVLGSARASSPMAVSEPKEPFYFPSSMLPQSVQSIDGLFAVTVERDDLEGIAIIDGDLVMFRPTTNAIDGDIVAIEDDRGDAAVRRYRESGGKRWVETVPANDDPTIIDASSVKILGVMVALNRAQ